MYKSPIAIAGALVIVSAGTLMADRAEAGASASAPTKYSQSQSATRQTALDRYGARAMVPGVGRAQIVPEGTSGQYENLYRYQGGPFPFW